MQFFKESRQFVKAHPMVQALVLAAAYCMVVSVITWPLLSLVITGNPERLYAEPSHCDTGGTLWFHWWFDNAVRNGFDFFDSPFLSYPAGENIWVTAGNFMLFLVAWPIMHLRGLIAGYNTIVWLLCLLNCLAGYYLVRLTIPGRTWAFIGGIGVAFNNFTFREMWSGRLEQLFVAAMVIGIAMLIRLAREPSWRTALGWAAALIITSLFSWHYGIMLGMVGALAMFGWSVRQNWRAVRFGIAGGAFALLALMPLILNLGRAFAGEYSWHPVASEETTQHLMLAIMRSESLDLATLQLRAPTISRFSVAFLLAPLSVGLVFFSALRRQGRSWMLFGGIALLMAMGPVAEAAGHTFPLPFLLLMKTVPYMVRFLWPIRFIIFFYIAASILLTMIFRQCWETTRPAGRLVLTAITALLIWGEIAGDSQIYRHLDARRFDQPRIYYELARMPPGAMLELPVNSFSMVAQTVHGKPLFSGSIATPAPIVPDRTRHILEESGLDGPPPVAPTARLRRFLNRHQFRYLLLNEKRFREIGACDTGCWRNVLKNYENEFGPPVAVDKRAGLVLFAVK